MIPYLVIEVFPLKEWPLYAAVPKVPSKSNHSENFRAPEVLAQGDGRSTRDAKRLQYDKGSLRVAIGSMFLAHVQGER